MLFTTRPMKQLPHCRECDKRNSRRDQTVGSLGAKVSGRSAWLCNAGRATFRPNARTGPLGFGLSTFEAEKNCFVKVGRRLVRLRPQLRRGRRRSCEAEGLMGYPGGKYVALEELWSGTRLPSRSTSVVSSLSFAGPNPEDALC